MLLCVGVKFVIRSCGHAPYFAVSLILSLYDHEFVSCELRGALLISLQLPGSCGQANIFPLAKEGDQVVVCSGS